MMHIKDKRGISLIVLIITVAVLLIIVSVTIYRSDNSRIVAEKAVLITEYSTVQDAVRSYYALNGEFPVPSSASKIEFTFDDIKSLNSEAELANEIELQYDDTAVFYLVDLSLLDIMSEKVGTHYLTEGSKDIFLISSPNLNIYYIDGKRVGANKYYSLSKRLTDSVNYAQGEVEDASVTSITSIIYNSRINVFGYSNSFNFDMRAIVKLNAGEDVEISTNSYSKKLNLSKGENILILKNLFSEDQLNEIDSTNTFRITIKNGENVVESKVCSTASNSLNFEFSSDPDNIHMYNTENTINFKIDSNLNISYVKYGYYNIFDASIAEGYKLFDSSLDTDEKWISNVNNYGSLAVMGNSKMCTITVPKNVKDIFVVAVDEEGNLIYTTKNVSNIYSETVYSNETNNTLKVLNKVVSTLGDANATVSYSLDGTTYQEFKSYNTSDVTKIEEIVIEDVYQKYIYVKTVLNVLENNYTFVNKVNATISDENNKTAPTLICLSITNPVTGTYSQGEQITIVATYDKNVYNSFGATIAASLLSAPALKIKFGTGDDIMLQATSSSQKNIIYTYNIGSDDAGTLSLVSYSGTIYDVIGNSRYITASSLTGSTIVAERKEIGLISYSQKNIGKLTTDSAFTNPLTKTGDGTVTYTSSNTSVATVNSSSRRSYSSRCRGGSNNCNSRR